MSAVMVSTAAVEWLVVAIAVDIGFAADAAVAAGHETAASPGIGFSRQHHKHRKQDDGAVHYLVSQASIDTVSPMDPRAM